MRTFLARIWVFVRQYRTRLLLGLFFGSLYAISSGALMSLVTIVVNLIFPGAGPVSLADHFKHAPAWTRPILNHLLQSLPQLKSPSSAFGKVLLISILPLVMFVRAISSYLNTYFTNWAAARSIADLRTRLFGHLQNLPMGFFSKASTGNLIARVINDTNVLHSVIATSLGSLIRDPLTVLTLLAFLLFKPETRKLALVSLSSLVVCLVPINIYARKVRKSARAMQGFLADLSRLMHEAFTGNRIIKAYNLEDTVLTQFQQIARKHVAQFMRVVRANEIPSQLTEFLGVVGVALVLIYVAFQPRPATPGDFVSFILSLLLMYPPIKSLTKLHNLLHQAAATSERVFELLETKSTVVEPARPVPLHAANADIEFQQVDFQYDDKPALRGINLTIKAGQLVALVGKTGSGKTSLINLLLRFYDPTRGVIRIGGVDLRDVAVKDLRSQTALVAQEVILFNDTIRRNIALGKPGATEDEIVSAAKHAAAHEFIMEKTQGYDTIVGEKGVTISGGQRQRIAIARAIVRNAPILVLDEATSSLDSESERAVQTALEELMHGRTTICIAHRLSTIQKADLIVVLDAGRIVETGTHAQLLQSGGVYSRLYELQFEPALA